jgi:uncharacterized RDD family membrane protein YckC/phage FluMu protein Com
VAIEFNCPRCGKFLTTTESRALALAKCPSCSELITVPATSESAEVAPAVSVASAMSPELAATAAWSSALTPGPSPGPTGGFAPAAAPIDAPSPGAPASDVPHQAAGVAPPLPVGGTPGDARTATGYGLTNRQACPRCGHTVVVGAAYCAGCGVALIPAAYPLQYAGYFRRMLAAAIDLTIVSLAAGALALLLQSDGWQPWFLLWFFYSAAMESSREQATFGKRMLGMIVCGGDGRRLTFPRAAIRTLAKLASLAICGMGYIMPLLTPKKQALHDLMTDAVVVLS